MIKILVVDDQEIVRAGLCRLLELESDFEVLGDASCGREAVAMCRELNPNVMLLDLDLPDIDGIEVTRQVKASFPDVRVLVLTMFGHEEYAVRILEAGGDGYAIKGISQKQLPEAIRKVASGKKFISQSIMEKTFMRQHDIDTSNPLSVLSERELQVFRKLAEGDSQQKIADDMSISESSVRTYKMRILEKLNLDSLADMIRFALRNNLISK